MRLDFIEEVVEADATHSADGLGGTEKLFLPDTDHRVTKVVDDRGVFAIVDEENPLPEADRGTENGGCPVIEKKHDTVVQLQLREVNDREPFAVHLATDHTEGVAMPSEGVGAGMRNEYGDIGVDVARLLVAERADLDDLAGDHVMRRLAKPGKIYRQDSRGRQRSGRHGHESQEGDAANGNR